jgi:hypothetical protein
MDVDRCAPLGDGAPAGADTPGVQRVVPTAPVASHRITLAETVCEAAERYRRSRDTYQPPAEQHEAWSALVLALEAQQDYQEALYAAEATRCPSAPVAYSHEDRSEGGGSTDEGFWAGASPACTCGWTGTWISGHPHAKYYAHKAWLEHAIAAYQAQETAPNLQQRVGEWGVTTFPHGTMTTIHRHLMEEAAELRSALSDWLTRQAPIAEFVWPTVMEEVADIILLALHLAHRGRFDLMQFVEDKFNEVKAREWAYDEEAGYYRHVEPMDNDEVDADDLAGDDVAGSEATP